MTPDRRAEAAPVAADEPAVSVRSTQLRTGAALLTGTFAYILPFGAAIGVLLPARLAEIDPGRKLDLLAVLMGATAVAGLVGNLACGSLADRTRSRFGPRLPWLVGGAIVGSLLLVPLARSTDVTGLLVWWCLAVVAFNATVSAVTALLAERVPRARRATAAAAAGAGNLLGQACGTWVGAATLSRPQSGFLVVAALVVPLALLAAGLAGRGPATTAGRGSDRLSPDRVRRGPVSAITAGALMSAVPSPSAAPDFYRALVGRVFLVLGFFMIDTYQFYIFTDHLRLRPDQVGPALALNALVFVVTALAAVAVAGPLADRWGRRRPFVAGGALVFVVGTGVPLALPTAVGMLVFSLLSGVGFGIVYSVDVALLTEVLPRPRDYGRDLGVLNAANIAGQVLAPAASAALLGLGAGFGPVFGGSMVACALGGACVLAIRSVR